MFSDFLWYTSEIENRQPLFSNQNSSVD